MSKRSTPCAALGYPRCGIVVTLVALLGLLFSASLAHATERKPLKITKFTLETTEAIKVPGPLSPENWGFVNKPAPFTQAGGHPDALTYTGEFESEEVSIEATHNTHKVVAAPTRDPKDIVTALPPGLLGNPTAVPRCPLKEALSFGEPCPAPTQVGVALIHFDGEAFVGPIVNVIPEAGQSAEFAIESRFKVNFLLTAHVVRTTEGYGLTVASNGIVDTGITSVELTFWGVPAAEIHDLQRGLFCAVNSLPGALWECGFELSTGEEIGLGGEKSGDADVVPFLTMPTDCSEGPETAIMKADSWEESGVYVETPVTMPGVTGCNLLQFNPGIGVEADTLLADEPTGLGINLTVPQFEEPQRLSTPELRNTVLTLPEGLSISPGVVDGVQACNESGPEGINFTGPESEEVGLNGESQLAAGHCPDASIVGEAEAVTPLLGVPVKGHVYLARPECGGAGQEACTEADALDGHLYRLYLELGGTGALADTGVNLKVAFDTEANPATGQLTTVVENTPQLPFSELKIHLNGGPRAPLDTPAVCGPATTTADFTPWSSPGTTPAPESLSMAGTPDATPSSFFDVSGCTSPPGLNPGFQAGTVTPQAGQFSAFTLNLSREDREQYVKGIQIHTPPGLLGMLSSVHLCGEEEADKGTCPESSKIGTTRVASGAGSHPFEIQGTVYLTGPHNGAPFGLSVVTPAVAGPFNLGRVVVRARIDVNPENSTLTVTTDETGPYALPQILDGVPLRLKQVTVNIDRPDFMFNPTNCGAPRQPGTQQVAAKVAGAENAVANVQSQFAVGGCKSLEFKPKFAVSASGHTSRSGGASLDAKLSFPSGSVGSEANIARVKVDLPKQLPSRLTTLQKACTAAQFESNPADCPAASIVGIARATTPLLPVGLSGPVYFVSHGGEAFPSLIVVLQGDGVRVNLIGATFISKAGITSSTFKTVPDVPVNTFEIYLPEGKYSALAANGDLCTSQSKLKMPTEFVAQNGAIIRESTKIAVTGCPKAKRSAKARKKAKAKKADGAGDRRLR